VKSDLVAVADYAEKVLPLAAARLDKEYYYQSLSLCVIDAAFSIGVRYEGVRNVIDRYCKNFGQSKFREAIAGLPSQDSQESISSLCEKFEKMGTVFMADRIFRNRQRTSPVGGILKSEAVYNFAVVLRRYGVEYFQDVEKLLVDRDFESSIKAIPGQGSGISLKYFFMLAGTDGLVKPDRMILGFLRDVLGSTPSPADAQSILSGACSLLVGKFPNMNPRLLDNEIWKYQRARA
jgi:hypothetical protein